MASELQPTEKKRNQFMEAMSSVAEASATLIPLVALILGIGMMRLIPAKVATPLFHSQDEAQSFYTKVGLQPSGSSPIMLVRASCTSCQSLQQDLYQHGIGFEQVDVGTPYGSALYEQSKRASSSHSLPIMIVGTSLVRPDVAAMKHVMGASR